MSVKGIGAAIVGSFSKAKFFAVENSPKICMIAGTVELGLTIYSACRGTMKFAGVLEEHRRRIDTIDHIAEVQAKGTATPEEASHDIKTDTRAVWIESAKGFVSCYWLTGVLAVGTVATYFAGFNILNKRLAKTAALAAGLALKLRDTENGIVKHFGAEGLEKVRGLHPDCATVETHVDEDTGEVVVDAVKQDIKLGAFQYIFDRSNPNFDKRPECSRYFLESVQNGCNFDLDMKESVFVNPIIERIGGKAEDKYRAGQICGWKKYDSDYEASQYGAANKIDFGLDDPINDDFWSGKRDWCLLTFNVDPHPIISALGYKELLDYKERIA